MGTNRKLLAKGIKYLSGCLPLLFIGPVVINSSFKNEESPLFPYVLGLGIMISGIAIFLGFKGINTIMKSLFDGNK
ncbi:membrane protein [Flavobacterium sp. 316]|uniref:DUF6095 family protein n=1 Tax=Flavobacterium sediminilitoris TaxID=2024526 RepID=A0ABY4HLP4_9FLAO|nr:MULTISPECIES: DUF6095 family protein [Flavobacterium]KIX20000.1 membrane protein [Flavobacterium sp. 316]UOX33779.1 DUF6095 family protein [Flavobacterium sediminilitoris]